jgi:hypothetical protein
MHYMHNYMYVERKGAVHVERGGGGAWIYMYVYIFLKSLCMPFVHRADNLKQYYTSNLISGASTSGWGHGARRRLYTAWFEVMGHVCTIRAHTQELCPNDKTLQILFTAFASEGNCRKSRRTLFFIIDVRIRQKTVVLIFWCLSWFFFSEKIFLLYGRN